MDVYVELRCFGMRLENKKFSDPAYCKKPRSKFVWLGRTFELHNRDKRATPIIGEENYALKLEICLPLGVTDERFASFQGSRLDSTKIHWTI
jgi:hypothetical protein